MTSLLRWAVHGRVALALVARRGGPRHAVRGLAAGDAPLPALLEVSSAAQRRARESRKWTRFEEAVLPLWVADSDFASPPAVRDAVRDAAAADQFGYVNPPAALVEAAQMAVGRSWGRPVDAAWFRWQPGLIAALYHAARLAGPAGAVAAPAPVYPPFRNAADDCSVRVDVDVGHGGEPLDEAALERALGEAVEKARGGDAVLLWCNPHNPTGRVWREAEMRAVAEACAARNVVLVSDEVWSGLVYDGPFTSAGRFHGQIPGLRLVVLTSPSKTYNVAGLDLALAVIPDDALRRRYFRAGRDQAEVPAAGYAAFRAVLAGEDGGGASRCPLSVPGGACEPWREAQLSYLRGNRDRAWAFVRDECGPTLAVAAAPPEASYLLWIDATRIPSPGLFFKKRGVYLTEGPGFGARGFVRLNFGCHRDTLDEGLRRLKAAVDAFDAGAA